MKSGFRRAVATLVFLVILAVIHLYIYTQNMNLKYSVTDLKIKLGNLRSKTRLLGSQVARQENLERIEKKARKELGMTYPRDVNYILIPQSTGE